MLSSGLAHSKLIVSKSQLLHLLLVLQYREIRFPAMCRFFSRQNHQDLIPYPKFVKVCYK